MPEQVPAKKCPACGGLTNADGTSFVDTLGIIAAYRKQVEDLARSYQVDGKFPAADRFHLLAIADSIVFSQYCHDYISQSTSPF